MADAVDTLIERYGADAVVAALSPQTSEERRARIEQVLEARLCSLTVAVENLYDPHNGAAAIRSCEAVGLSAIDVVETGEPFRFSKKVTIGCEKWIDVRRHRSVAECAEALRARDMTLYAAVPGAELSVHELDVERPVALLIGNEHEGLTDAAIAACDRTFSIPMSGFTESLNLSVSVAVSVHGLAARRRAAIGRPGDLPAEERAHLRARWYALGVRGVGGIVERHVSEMTR
jgi:tRNA (guanosine-2'-O-)-methyltransferase